MLANTAQSDDREERIRDAAYFLGLEEGCPEGQADRHWGRRGSRGGSPGRGPLATPRHSFLATIALRQANDDVAISFAQAAQGGQAIDGLAIKDDWIAARVVALRRVRAASRDCPMRLGRNRIVTIWPPNVACAPASSSQKRPAIGGRVY